MAEEQGKLARISNYIAKYPDFPKPGVLFRDIFPLFHHPDAVNDLIELMKNHILTEIGNIDYIAGIESRGFLFAVPLSLLLHIPFIPIRKKGKLPGDTENISINLEYGEDSIEMPKNVIKENQKVVIVDDLLATGGTLQGACKLVKKLGAQIAECLIVIELVNLNGRSNVSYPLHSMLKYPQESP